MPCAQELGFEELDGGAGRGVQDARKMELNENILDVPLSWVARVTLTKEQLRLKYPPRGASPDP
jgi:hypothetical protein